MRKLLICIAIASLTVPQSAGAMNYALIPYQSGAALLAQGAIGSGEAAKFLNAVEQARAAGVMPNTVIISSPGGNLGGAVNFGFVVRQLGMRTVVGSLGRDPSGQLLLAPGGCHSACVMALMAGVQRSVTPGSRVSVHSPQAVFVSGGQAYNLDPESNRYLVERSAPALRAYARVMGVSPAVIDLANRVPSTTARRLSSAELASFRLTVSPNRAVRSRGPTKYARRRAT